MRLGHPPRPATEAEGRAVLKAAFTRAGYHIIEDYHFVEGGVDVSLDGWDPVNRVGYEYMTREAGDHTDFSRGEIGELVRRHEAGELRLLLIDGDGKPDKQIIEYLAKNFIKELKAEEAEMRASAGQPVLTEERTAADVPTARRSAQMATAGTDETAVDGKTPK